MVKSASLNESTVECAKLYLQLVDTKFQMEKDLVEARTSLGKAETRVAKVEGVRGEVEAKVTKVEGVLGKAKSQTSTMKEEA